MGSTCKGHVEQVQVVHRILQVLVQIVVLIDGASHLFLAIVDGNQRQGTERFLMGLAPQDIGHLQTPVGIRDDDIVELQSFTLMNCQDADTIRLCTLYGLGTNGLVPLADKRVDIRCIVLAEL